METYAWLFTVQSIIACMPAGNQCVSSAQVNETLVTLEFQEQRDVAWLKLRQQKYRHYSLSGHSGLIVNVLEESASL